MSFIYFPKTRGFSYKLNLYKIYNWSTDKETQAALLLQNCPDIDIKFRIHLKANFYNIVTCTVNFSPPARLQLDYIIMVTF